MGSNLRFLARLSTLEACWSVLDKEPGMDNIASGASEVLKQMGEDLKIFPFQDTKGQDKLFLARFEFPKYGEKFAFPNAGMDGAYGFIDFLAGFPLDCVEMLLAIGEQSSKPKASEPSKVFVQGGGKASAPMPPNRLFKWPEKNKILLNLTAIQTADVAQILAPGLEGEPIPKTPKWWFRVQVLDEGHEGPNTFPVPGEFLGLGVRMWPGKYWGHQKSSPFVFAGNWMDSVYYTQVLITEVVDPTDEVPYPTYKAIWHGKTEVTLYSSDFSEYKVGDRVTVVKDVATTKKSELWKDDDMKADCDKNTWQIVPIVFYGLEREGG